MITTKQDDLTNIADYITRNPDKVFVLRNDNASRADSNATFVFERWCSYWVDKGMPERAAFWRYLRRGGSEFLTLPTIDPADFDREWSKRPHGAKRGASECQL